MSSWESSLIASRPVQPASPLPRNAIGKSSPESRQSRPNAVVEGLPRLPVPISKYRSEPKRVGHRYHRSSKRQMQPNRQDEQERLPDQCLEHVEAQRSSCQRDLPVHKRSALAALPKNIVTTSKGSPLKYSRHVSQPQAVLKNMTNESISPQRHRLSPRKLLWPAISTNHNSLRRQRVPTYETDAYQLRSHWPLRQQRSKSPLESCSTSPDARTHLHRAPFTHHELQSPEKKKLSYAEQRYRPQNEKQSELLRKGIQTALTITRIESHGKDGNGEDKPQDERRPNLLELAMEKLPQSPPTVHVYDSHLPPIPGLPPTVSPSKTSLTSEKIDFDTPSLLSSEGLRLENAASKRAMRKMLRWEIWLYRILFGTVLVALNISLLIVYLFTPRHHYLLAFLVFMKSKDLISTMAGFLAIVWYVVRNAIWSPADVDSQWIMSIVCAYAETESQIIKTINSLMKQDLVQHKQVICIILDGKPRDVLSRFTRVTHMMKRPYNTWKGAQGELQVHAGFIDEVPVLLIQKTKNAGKKDTLILGHSLFNHPRSDAPMDIKLLRRDVFTYILPTLTRVESFKAFDYVYATDADSTIHKECLKELANALSRNPKTIAACGIILAELEKSEEWSAWHLFQQFQYTFGQYVRRQAESVWGRVTCLPGPVTMTKVRPEMGKAISDYAAPITTANLFLHQVQYQGTDRRLTWCMLSQDKRLQTILVPTAIGETVVPTTLDHYLSQRRRWAANAYFNDYMYALGKHQHPITRLFALIDIIRMSFVYYRVMNTALFVRSLARHFYLIKIIPTLILTKSPTAWFLLLVLAKEPVLRKRLHKIICGIVLNQIMSPVLSVIVFSRVLLNMGNHAWGKTGVGSRDTKDFSMAYIAPSPPKSPWSPRRLVSVIRNAVHSSLLHDQLSENHTERSTSISTRSTKAPTIASTASSVSSMSDDLDVLPISEVPRTPPSAFAGLATTPEPATPNETTQIISKILDSESTIRKRARHSISIAP